jgi:hypothetical protein
MGELRQLPGGKSDEVPCEWCHKDYDCHGKGHNRYNCPRADGLQFFSAENAYYDKDGNLIWDVQHVTFRSYDFEAESSPEEETPDADSPQPDTAESS